VCRLVQIATDRYRFLRRCILYDEFKIKEQSISASSESSYRLSHKIIRLSSGAIAKRHLDGGQHNFPTSRSTETTIEPQSVNVGDWSGGRKRRSGKKRDKNAPEFNQPSMQSVSEISKVSLSSTFSEFPNEFDEGAANRRFFSSPPVSLPSSFAGDAALARP